MPAFDGAADLGARCAELGCPTVPEVGGIRCAACKAKPLGPLHARPHRPVDVSNGKCTVCGREDYDGIHLERL